MTAADFESSKVTLIGHLNQYSSEKVCFIWNHAQEEYDASAVWGFRDTLDRDYRSVDGSFFLIENHGPIWLYSLQSDEEHLYKISAGLNGDILELTTKNLEALLSENKDLESEFKKLKKGQKESSLLDYLGRLNLFYEKEGVKFKWKKPA